MDGNLQCHYLHHCFGTFKPINWIIKFFQEVIKALHEETQYIDKDTKESVHANLGMFVLALMSHGGYGTIAAKDGNTGTMTQIKLVDIYRLLSSQNFPAMRGKPKMIILHACSGAAAENRDNPSMFLYESFKTEKIEIYSSAPFRIQCAILVKLNSILLSGLLVRI